MIRFYQLWSQWIKSIIVWMKLTVHNSWGIINVFYIVWVRPMKGGLLPSDHPMVTGKVVGDEDVIWPKNIIFSSIRDARFSYSPSDVEIISEVGEHMRRMVAKSSNQEDFPHGRANRMPPAINYIHGCVHYNGGFLLFNDFREAISHFTNKEFQQSFCKFIKEEKREPVTVFRDRNYDRMEFLEFVCFLRSIFPWFSNSNGNKNRIGWGNPAPYAAVNTITGNWINDTFKIYDANNLNIIARAPISKKYFLKESYLGTRDYTIAPEKFLARFTNKRVLARGEKGNLFFVDLRKIKQGYLFNPATKLPNILNLIKEKFL